MNEKTHYVAVVTKNNNTFGTLVDLLTSGLFQYSKTVSYRKMYQEAHCDGTVYMQVSPAHDISNFRGIRFDSIVFDEKNLEPEFVDEVQGFLLCRIAKAVKTADVTIWVNGE